MAHRRSDDPYAQDAYYHRNPTSWEPTEPAGPPPRRSKSERKPARPSPDDRGASRRHREEDAPRGSSHRQGDARRPQSPPPPYHYEDRRGGDSRHDPRNTRDARDPRDARDSRDPREVGDPRGSRDLRDARDVRDSRSTRPEPPRGDRHEDPHRHQRNKTAEDPGRYRRSSPDHRSSKEYLPRDDRDQARRGGAAYTKSRGRDPSPSHAGRPKTRSSTDDVGRDRHIGHSSRAQGKDKPSSRDLATTEPPRGRDKHASSGTRGVGVGGIAAKVRSSTMPAAEKAAGWWKNPAIQASARTALTAGAAAAMNNRGAKGEWIGAKGVKVGFAALSAALASGGLDSVKRDDGGSGGGGRDRDRGRSSSRDRGRGRSAERGKDKSSGRSKSEGLGGGDYKQKIMQTGLDYFMKKAAAGR